MFASPDRLRVVSNVAALSVLQTLLIYSVLYQRERYFGIRT